MNGGTVAEIQAWIQLGSVLVSAGVATVTQIREAVRSLRGEAMTEAELNAICESVIADAGERKARRQAEADGA